MTRVWGRKNGVEGGDVGRVKGGGGRGWVPER